MEMHVTNGREQTYYDFDKFGWSDANFIIDPDNFFVRVSPLVPLLPPSHH